MPWSWVGRNYATFTMPCMLESSGLLSAFSVTPESLDTPRAYRDHTGPNGFRGLNMTIPEPSPLKVLLAAMPLILTCRTILTAGSQDGA